MSWRSPTDREMSGREARERAPLEGHAQLETTDRPDPVRVLGDQARSRVPELVPLRHSRMLASPFAFFRGAAALMAGDLARTPVSGLEVQLCGDAHLANFGMFASPERALVFDINDFDETCPGPWEWDVKRLVTSLVIAGQANGFSPKQTRKIARAAARRYASAMSEFATMGNLALWHSRVDAGALEGLLGDQLDREMRTRVEKSVAKAQTRDHVRAFNKLTEVVDGQRRIIADPPVVVPIAQLAEGMARDDVEQVVRGVLDEYSRSLDPSYRRLVDSYSFVDMARKAVGVGSVGTRCWIVLMRGRDDDDPLFLQVKEAQRSVLADHLGTDCSAGDQMHQGRRVVVGQRLMQATGDVFLGWHSVTGLDGLDRDFYVRQLHDWKGSAAVETLKQKGLRLYGELCAWTLARAHARTGDRIAIAGYCGDGSRLADALADFAHAYATLNEQDYAAFASAVQAGELSAVEAGQR
jgi:uncharacterized protein (DUF2252 family)